MFQYSTSITYFFAVKKESDRDKQLKEEAKILDSVAERTALRGVAELAKDIQYHDSIKTG